MVDQIAVRHADIVSDSDQRHAARAMPKEQLPRGGERFVARLPRRAAAPGAATSGSSLDYRH
ncbi:MAG TPA: hypothetical protein VNX86_13545 [Rhizomicrobium sp.]|nr:hypothetical protein [Rhizomicrobium sp.]